MHLYLKGLLLGDPIPSLPVNFRAKESKSVPEAERNRRQTKAINTVWKVFTKGCISLRMKEVYLENGGSTCTHNPFSSF